jgi:hypothetical protein
LTGKPLTDYGIKPSGKLPLDLNLRAVSNCRPCQQKKGFY